MVKKINHVDKIDQNESDSDSAPEEVKLTAADLKFNQQK